MRGVSRFWMFEAVRLGVSGAMAFGALAGACGGTADSTPAPAAPEKVRVVTTMAILADFVRNMGGDRVEVRSIVDPGADVHSFQPTPGDSVAISRAKLIVSNGRGLDAFLDPVIDAAKSSDALHIVAAEGIEFSAPAEAEDSDPEDERGRHGEGDPHLWLNPLNAVRYVERIRDGLAQVDPEGVEEYRAGAEAYASALRALDGEIARALEAVPTERRHLVTFHDAFGHFADRYGWEVAAFVKGDAGEVTPEAVVVVLDRIVEQGIPMVFAEPQFSSDVLHSAASDAGVGVGTIYSDVLDGPASTYLDMMRFNLRSLLGLVAREEE